MQYAYLCGKSWRGMGEKALDGLSPIFILQFHKLKTEIEQIENSYAFQLKQD